MLGARDARGRLRGLVRYWRPDGSLVSECEHRRGVPHGAARRYYEDGARFQTCTYVDGKLHGARTFYPPTGPTAEPPLPGWDRVGANVVAYRVEYERGEIVATRFLAARGREVQQSGAALPRRPRGLPATASPMAGGWLEMRRREVAGGTGTEVLLTREYRTDGTLHRERIGLEEREYHASGALHEHGGRIAVGASRVMHGPWRYFDEAGVLRRESVYARGVETRRTWFLARGEHPAGARRRAGPVAQGAWVPSQGHLTLEHGTWMVQGARGRVLASVELGPALEDAQVIALPALADDAGDAALAALADATDAARVLDRLCARIRLAGRTGSREPFAPVLGPAAPWTEWRDDATRGPLAERIGRYDGPPLMEVLHGLTWGAPPADVLGALSSIMLRRGLPRLALDLSRAALLFADAPALHAAEAASLRDLGDEAGADEVLAAMPDRITPEEERLLAAIRDAPEDDQPRLVYADWLLERSEPRGELITTQCTLARLPEDGPTRKPLERRARALLAAHGERWYGGIEGLEEPTFERGFLERWWSVSAQAVVEHADRLWRLAPSRQLKIEYAADAITQLAACPALARYRALRFWDTVIDDDEIARLARCPYLAGLEELGIADCSLGDDGLIELARSPHLANLRSLDISGRDNDFRNTGFGALAGAIFAPRLESLAVRQRWLEPEAAAVLAAFPALVDLELGCNSLGDTGVARLAELPLRLTSLGLYMNGITAAGARALAGSAVLDAVHTLDVSANPMGEAGGIALVGSPHLRSLRHLTYGGENGIPNAAVAAAIARSLPRLEHLQLSLARIGPDGAAALAAGDLPALDGLGLHNNGVGDAGALALARSTTLPSLRWLDISNNGLTDAGALALAESPHLPALKHLLIGGTRIEPRAAAALRARFGSGLALKNTWER